MPHLTFFDRRRFAWVLAVPLALGSTWATASASPADLAGTIAELGAPALAVRTAAEQELTTLLASSAGAGAERGDYQRISGELRRILGADVLLGEARGNVQAARRSVSVILGADDRLLGMAIHLATQGRAAVRTVGEDAILAQLTRWSRSVLAEPDAGAYDLPRQNVPLPGPLLERASFQVSLDPNGSAPDSKSGSSGASALDLLDRRGGAPLPIVVDPAFIERMERRPANRLGAARIDGSWSEVLEQLCAIHDGAFQLHGYRYPDEVFPSDLSLGDVKLPPARPWIHVVQRGTTELAPLGRDLRTTGAATILRWCRSAGGEGNAVRQAAAARALAVLGWPAAVHWMEQRWAWYGDIAALEGLMAAAARGRVAASLQDPRCLRTILALVERDAKALERLRVARTQAMAPETVRDTGGRYEAAASAMDGRLQRLSLGLRRLVPMLVSGSDLQPADELLFADFDTASLEGQWLRLAIAEGLGIESNAAASAAQDVLARPVGGFTGEVRAALLRPLRRQALRTLGVVRRADRGAGADPAAILVASIGDLLSPVRIAGGRDVVGVGLELGRLEPLEVNFGADNGFGRISANATFSWASLERRPKVLREILVWAALAADVRGESERAPAWVLKSVRAGLREWEASRSPDVRATARCAVRLAARELRVLGGTPLRALLRWVEPGLDPADLLSLESLLVQAGAFTVGGRSASGDDGPRQRALQRALAAVEDSVEDADQLERSWLDLAALCADEVLGSRARSAFVGSLVAAMGDPSGTAATSSTVAFAAESALQAMREARLDGEAEALLRTLQKGAQAARHPLGQRFRQSDWPPKPVSVPRDLERVDPVRPPVFRFR